MELIERYIQDVVRRLPRREREDVARELRSALTDAQERLQEAGFDREQAAETLLRDWLRPAEQARSYRAGPDHLIGPRHLDAFWKAVRVGVLIVALLAAIGPLLSLIDDPLGLGDVLAAAIDWWNSFFLWALAVIGGVTLVLAIVERRSSAESASGETDGEWDPKALPDRKDPDRKDPDRLDRPGVTIELILVVALLALLNWRPETLGIPVTVNGVRVALPLSWPELGATRLLLDTLLIGGATMLWVVLRRGRWNLTTRLWSLGLSVLQIWVFLRLRTEPDLFALNENRLVGANWPRDLAVEFIDAVDPILAQVQDRGFLLLAVIAVVEVVVKGAKLMRRRGLV